MVDCLSTSCELKAVPHLMFIPVLLTSMNFGETMIYSEEIKLAAISLSSNSPPSYPSASLFIIGRVSMHKLCSFPDSVVWKKGDVLEDLTPGFKVNPFSWYVYLLFSESRKDQARSYFSPYFSLNISVDSFGFRIAIGSVWFRAR